MEKPGQHGGVPRDVICPAERRLAVTAKRAARERNSGYREVAGGAIAAIDPHLRRRRSIDARGRLVSPGLVESHFHLDKALIVDRCEPPKDRRAGDHMKRTAAIKHTFTEEDVYARASATLEQCLLNGVTHMRTHVEVDPNVGLRGYAAIERLVEDYAWGIDLQPAVFLQGRLDHAGAQANVSRPSSAARRGGGARATTPMARPDRSHLRARPGVRLDVDIHLDGGYTTHDLDIFQVCDLTDRIGWGGRVAIGHGSKYSCLPLEELDALGRRMADSGVALAVLPATDLYNTGRHLDHSVIRGVADANALIAQGANCSISTNNVMNPFTPYGDCSLVRIANMYANVLQRGTEGELTDCFAMLTDRAARIMRRKDYGIAAGNPADLVVWNAKTPAEVIAKTRAWGASRPPKKRSCVQ